MSEIRRMEFQCYHCKAWFKSPIDFRDEQSFETSTLFRNAARCKSCGRMAPCNKENMRWTRSDGRGGWVGVDTRS